jgi:hypothetical protein
MKQITLLFAIILSVVFSDISQQESGKNIAKERGKEMSTRIDFNREWTFVLNQAEWAIDFIEKDMAMKPVILPHTWNANDMGPGLIDPCIGSCRYR